MIRLSRVGKKKQPSYRVIVSEKQKDPWGEYLEIVGFYNPLSKPKIVQFNAERVNYWLSKGAHASATVHNLLVNAGVVSGKKQKATKGKKKTSSDKAEASAA